MYCVIFAMFLVPKCQFAHEGCKAITVLLGPDIYFLKYYHLLFRILIICGPICASQTIFLGKKQRTELLTKDNFLQ